MLLSCENTAECGQASSVTCALKYNRFHEPTSHTAWPDIVTVASSEPSGLNAAVPAVRVSGRLSNSAARSAVVRSHTRIPLPNAQLVVAIHRPLALIAT